MLFPIAQLRGICCSSITIVNHAFCQVLFNVAIVQLWTSSFISNPKFFITTDSASGTENGTAGSPEVSCSQRYDRAERFWIIGTMHTGTVQESTRGMLPHCGEKKCHPRTTLMYQADQSGFSTHWDGIETWLTLGSKWLLIGLRDISASSWVDREENFRILWSFLLHGKNAKNVSHHKSYGLLNLHWKNKHNWLKMHSILIHETWFIEH